MKLNIFSDLRKPGLVPGESLLLSENYEFCCRETLITHRFDCSNRSTRNVSPASCKAIITVDCKCRSALIPCMISFTTL